MINCRRCYLVPEQKVVQVPYTTCRMVPEERYQTITCQRCKLVPEERVCQVPYVTCHTETQECVRQIPHTECHLEPYCVTYKVCRCVPVCVPVEPCCTPCCPQECCSLKPHVHHWLARSCHARPMVECQATCDEEAPAK